MCARYKNLATRRLSNLMPPNGPCGFLGGAFLQFAGLCTWWRLPRFVHISPQYSGWTANARTLAFVQKHICEATLFIKELADSYYFSCIWSAFCLVKLLFKWILFDFCVLFFAYFGLKLFNTFYYPINSLLQRTRIFFPVDNDRNFYLSAPSMKVINNTSPALHFVSWTTDSSQRYFERHAFRKKVCEKAQINRSTGWKGF